ncbi:hypothetical protein D9M68_968200 [compost metagenome]
MRHQHRVLHERPKRRQHLVDGRLPDHHGGPNAVNRNGGRRDDPLCIHQLLETFLLQQLAVDDARGADLQDLVALGWVQPRGFGVEHGVRQIGQTPIVQ